MCLCSSASRDRLPPAQSITCPHFWQEIGLELLGIRFGRYVSLLDSTEQSRRLQSATGGGGRIEMEDHVRLGIYAYQDLELHTGTIGRLAQFEALLQSATLANAYSSQVKQFWSLSRAKSASGIPSAATGKACRMIIQDVSGYRRRNESVMHSPTCSSFLHLT